MINDRSLSQGHTLRTEAVVETALVATHMTRSYGSTNHAKHYTGYYTAAVPFWRRPAHAKVRPQGIPGTLHMEIAIYSTLCTCRLNTFIAPRSLISIFKIIYSNPENRDSRRNNSSPVPVMGSLPFLLNDYAYDRCYKNNTTTTLRRPYRSCTRRCDCFSITAHRLTTRSI